MSPLTWAALLCTGLGGSLGLASQNLASKLATPAQHLQRPAGTAQATRAARQDLPAATAIRSFALGCRSNGSSTDPSRLIC